MPEKRMRRSRISIVSPSITVACPAMESAAAVGTNTSINVVLTTVRHTLLMTDVIVTPQFLNLESPRLAKAILEHIIAHANIVGEDAGGRPVLRFEFACDPWLMDKLASYGAVDEDREAEPCQAA
ncbi:MAG: hypothetical protein ACR2QH_00320 [Geminicoccaceae bacterium]